MLAASSTQLFGELLGDQLCKLHEITYSAGTGSIKMKAFDANSSRPISITARRIADHCYLSRTAEQVARHNPKIMAHGAVDRWVGLGDPELVAERIGVEIWQ